MEDRFPVPIFFETHPGHTKERYLKSRANPSNIPTENKDVNLNKIIFFVNSINKDFYYG